MYIHTYIHTPIYTYTHIHTHSNIDMLNLIHFHTEEFQKSVNVSCCNMIIQRKYTTVTSMPRI